MSEHTRYQKRIKRTTRKRISSSVIRALDAWVKSEARRYGVSRSFVTAVCISHASKIALDEDYKVRLQVIQGGKDRKRA
jgi:hypothetical protein